MFLIPGVAVSPTPHRETPLPWDAPIKPEKCGLEGKSIGWVAALQVASKVSSYRDDPTGTSGASVVVVGCAVVAVVSVADASVAVVAPGTVVDGSGVDAGPQPPTPRSTTKTIVTTRSPS
jgi:hypothetical protein